MVDYYIVNAKDQNAIFLIASVWERSLNMPIVQIYYVTVTSLHLDLLLVENYLNHA